MKCKECGEMPPTLRNVIEAMKGRSTPESARCPCSPARTDLNQVERSYHMCCGYTALVRRVT